MTEKRWLIRTKSKQILGPASKEKIISLLEKNSLSEDDELTSGNGYWFWIREKDLVDKYLYQSEKQSFNPISEAETKLGPYIEKPSDTSASLPSVAEIEMTSDEQAFPSDNDLEFPEVVAIDPEDLALSTLKIESTDSPRHKEENDDTLVDIAEMLNPRDKEIDEASEDNEDEDDGSENDGPFVELEKPVKMPKSNKRSNDRYLFILLLIIIMALAGVFYYYRTVLGRPIPIIGMSDAHAQGLDSLVKKKQLLS